MPVDMSPSEVPEALRWLDQVAGSDPQWLTSALKRMDPGQSYPAGSELMLLFAVYQQRNSLQ